MASLTNTKIKDTYDGLLKTTDNDALGGTYKLITDGLGNSSGVYLGTGGNVGIGQSSPTTYKLDVNGTLRVVSTAYFESGINAVNYIYHSGDTNTFFGFPANDTFTITTNNAERMRIKSDGKVGIGTNNPQKKLVISETTNATIRINSTKNGSWTAEEGLGHLEFFGNDTSGEGAAVKAKISATSKDTFGTAFNMTFGTTDGTSGISERMRIRYDGNVGIGTNNPLSKLQVEHNDFARLDLNLSDSSGTTIADVRGLVTGTEKWRIGKTGSSSDDFTINVDGSERMRIDSSGNVGIGTTNPGTFKLDVAGSARSNFFALRTNQSLPSESAAIYRPATGTFAIVTAAAERMRIDSSGNVVIGTSSNRPDLINDNGIAIANSGIQYQFSTSHFSVLKSSSTGTKIFFRYGTSGSQNTEIGSISYPTTSSVAYNTTSDYRLKENVVDMTGALDRVEQLQPKRFNFIQDPEITFDGFLAHEVQSVIPEAITGEKDAVDDEGNPQYQGIDQSKIVPLLVGAIKELKTEIETLKSQINS